MLGRISSGEEVEGTEISVEKIKPQKNVGGKEYQVFRNFITPEA